MDSCSVHPLHIFGEKMKNVILGTRLTAVANLVRKGSRIADIGTDHAYLIAYLLKKGICTYGYACDINENPLKKAVATIRENQLEDKSELILCDGLQGIEKDSVDDIVIAGMGGETIISILQNCSWSSDEAKHFVLQPMTKASLLRRFLCENGFEIQDEIAVLDSSHIYTVMSVYYVGKKRIPSELFCELGRLADKKDSQSVLYIKNRAAAILKKAEGLSKNSPESAEPVYKLYDSIMGCLQ